MEIVDEVFADYQTQGKLAPVWRWEVADASVYARRSLCVQYHESDLAFVRLMIQSAAGRLAAGVAVGGWIPVAGWVLLGVGIAASVGAAVLEPTRIEAWARQTPFGNGPDKQKFRTLGEQNRPSTLR